MREPDLIELFIRPLNRTAVPYMVSGAVAAVVYGEPRATLDIDIAVSLRQNDLAQLRSAYSEEEYYLPSADVLAVEIGRESRGHFNIIHSGSGLKADFYPSTGHPYFSWAMEHRRPVSLRDEKVMLAPPEYVILWKLEFYRESADPKHLRDIAAMLRLSNPDRALTGQAAAELGLEEQWSAAEKAAKG